MQSQRGSFAPRGPCGCNCVFPSKPFPYKPEKQEYTWDYVISLTMTFLLEREKDENREYAASLAHKTIKNKKKSRARGIDFKGKESNDVEIGKNSSSSSQLFIREIFLYRLVIQIPQFRGKIFNYQFFHHFFRLRIYSIFLNKKKLFSFKFNTKSSKHSKHYLLDYHN